MNSETRNTKKRLVIYYLAAFLPLLFMTLILNQINGAPIFAVFDGAKTEGMNVYAYVIGVFGMYMPALAALFTRLVTKEGMKKHYLKLGLKGNARYYLAALTLAVFQNILLLLIIRFRFLGDLSWAQAFDLSDLRLKLGAFLLQFAASVIMFFPAFGEEWGWRGYMMPKLTELFGKGRALVIGGVLWGLWHAPLTVSGHNFGLNYPGFPWLGILLMCIFCTVYNAILTWMTERTGSIYPASFCHMLNNNLSLSIFLPGFLSKEAMECEALSSVGNVQMFLLLMPGMALAGIVCAVFYLRGQVKLLKGRTDKKATIKKK